MTSDLRSFGQKSRHQDARKAIADRRELVELLVRHEATLKQMLRETRAALKSVDAHGHIRASAPTGPERSSK